MLSLVLLTAAWSALLGGTPAHAASTYYLGAGALLHNGLGKSAGTETGSGSLIGTPYPQLSFAARFENGGVWRWVPGLLWTPPFRRDQDGAALRTLLVPSFSAERVFANYDIRLGAGVLFYFLRGAGGTSILDNGNSTSTFYLPERSVATRTFLIDVGIGWTLGAERRWRVDFDNWITGALSSRRSISWVLNGSLAL